MINKITGHHGDGQEDHSALCWTGSSSFLDSRFFPPRTLWKPRPSGVHAWVMSRLAQLVLSLGFAGPGHAERSQRGQRTSSCRRNSPPLSCTKVHREGVRVWLAWTVMVLRVETDRGGSRVSSPSRRSIVVMGAFFSKLLLLFPSVKRRQTAAKEQSRAAELYLNMRETCRKAEACLRRRFLPAAPFGTL